MSNHKWDLKSNYMLAFTVCKYGLNSEQWNLIAKDLADYINTTPQNCKVQFNLLCEEYDPDWQKQSSESLPTHIFSIIKRLYYGDLCERMTESRDLLMVMYDFIRLFKGGRITPNDINQILHDVKNSVTTDDNERQQKIKMLERLKSHMISRINRISDSQQSSFPVELLPPPPFFQQPSTINNTTTNLPINENDRQVPSVDNRQKINTTETASSLPIITHSNNNDIDEIELSSDDSNDRTTTTTTAAHISTIDEPATSSNLINDQDESTFISDEQIETNESSNIPPIPIEGSSSNDKDLYDNGSTTSISNQSTFDTGLSNEERATSSINGHPTPSNLQLNTSISSSSDYVTLDSDRILSTHKHHHHHHHPIQSESNETTPRRIPVVDDEVARMDAEQIPEPIPADITDVTAPNDNAVFVIDELVSNTDAPKISSTNIDEQSMTSDITFREIDASSEGHENGESINTRGSRRQSHLTTSSISSNYRKSISSILNNLKTAKYGPDFAKPLKSFKLPDEYYIHIKKPLDIPEIRERMNNGDYDDNILLFQRDILLMFTNALVMYDRDLDIHNRAQYMINYAMELLTPLEDVITPWKMNSNGNGDDLSSVFHGDSDDNTLHTRTPSISSTSSSIRTDNHRHQSTSNYPTAKRQRKTTN